MDIPDIRYAKSGDVSVAYRVVGDGAVDLVFIAAIGNLASEWEQPVAGSGIEFEERGTHLLKGAPGEWRLFAVRNA